MSHRYAPLVTLGNDAASGVQVLFDSTLPIAARDPATGWPCEVANEWTVYVTGKKQQNAPLVASDRPSWP